MNNRWPNTNPVQTAMKLATLKWPNGTASLVRVDAGNERAGTVPLCRYDLSAGHRLGERAPRRPTNSRGAAPSSEISTLRLHKRRTLQTGISASAQALSKK